MPLCLQWIASLQISDYAVTVFGGIERSVGHFHLPQLLHTSGSHGAADALASVNLWITDYGDIKVPPSRAVEFELFPCMKLGERMHHRVRHTAGPPGCQTYLACGWRHAS
ncbi:hypothetical protein GB937_007910 [Aspergillus fischeri]|nr:hypothetical protein GB937_007910 [Aspergillus fischeri]